MRPGERLLEQCDALLRADAAHAEPREPRPLRRRGDDAHIGPEAPIDDADGAAEPAGDPVAEGVLEARRRGVVGLPRSAGQRDQRREQRHVSGRRHIRERVRQPERALDLGAQRRLEIRVVHRRYRSVGEDERRMHDTGDRAVARAQPLHQRPHRRAVGGVDRDVLRAAAQFGEQCRDAGVCGPTPGQHDTSAIPPGETPRERHADAARAAHDQMHAASVLAFAVVGSRRGRQRHGPQRAAQPAFGAVGDLLRRARLACFGGERCRDRRGIARGRIQVHRDDPEPRLLAREAEAERGDAAAGWIHRVGVLRSLRTFRDRDQGRIALSHPGEGACEMRQGTQAEPEQGRKSLWIEAVGARERTQRIGPIDPTHCPERPRDAVGIAVVDLPCVGPEATENRAELHLGQASAVDRPQGVREAVVGGVAYHEGPAAGRHGRGRRRRFPIGHPNPYRRRGRRGSAREKSIHRREHPALRVQHAQVEARCFPARQPRMHQGGSVERRVEPDPIGGEGQERPRVAGPAEQRGAGLRRRVQHRRVRIGRPLGRSGREAQRSQRLAGAEHDRLQAAVGGPAVEPRLRERRVQRSAAQVLGAPGLDRGRIAVGKGSHAVRGDGAAHRHRALPVDDLERARAVHAERAQAEPGGRFRRQRPGPNEIGKPVHAPAEPGRGHPHQSGRGGRGQQRAPTDAVVGEPRQRGEPKRPCGAIRSLLGLAGQDGGRLGARCGAGGPVPGGIERVARQLGGRDVDGGSRPFDVGTGRPALGDIGGPSRGHELGNFQRARRRRSEQIPDRTTSRGRAHEDAPVRRRPTVEERLDGRRGLGRRGGQDRQPVLEPGAAALEGARYPGERRRVPRREPFTERGRRAAQSDCRSRRNGQQGGTSAGRRRVASGCERGSGQHDVRHRAAEAEGADPRDAALARPLLRRCDEPEGSLSELEQRVRIGAMEGRRQRAVAEREEHLRQSRQTTRRLEMADVRLHRAEADGAGREERLAATRRVRRQRVAKTLDLQRIAEFGAGAVRLDIADRGGADVRLGPSAQQQLRLGGGVRRGERRRVPAVSRRGAEHHA